jgi:hypothetical protein
MRALAVSLVLVAAATTSACESSTAPTNNTIIHHTPTVVHFTKGSTGAHGQGAAATRTVSR